MRFEAVPVIFANGEDDDLPGLMAAFENRRVQFDDRIFEPGEDIVIEGRRLFLSKAIWIAAPDDTPEERLQSIKAMQRGWAVASWEDGFREVSFSPDCVFRVEGGKEGSVESVMML